MVRGKGSPGDSNRAMVWGAGLRGPAQRSSALTAGPPQGKGDVSVGGWLEHQMLECGAGQGLPGLRAHTGDVAVDSLLHRLSTMSALWMRRRAAKRASSVALSWAPQLAIRARTGQVSWVKESICSGW